MWNEGQNTYSVPSYLKTAQGGKGINSLIWSLNTDNVFYERKIPVHCPNSCFVDKHWCCLSNRRYTVRVRLQFTLWCTLALSHALLTSCPYFFLTSPYQVLCVGDGDVSLLVGPMRHVHSLRWILITFKFVKSCVQCQHQTCYVKPLWWSC